MPDYEKMYHSRFRILKKAFDKSGIEENPEYLEKIEQRIKQQGDKLDLTMTSSDLEGVSSDDETESYNIDIPIADEE